MHTKNKQWKNKFRTIKLYALPRTSELERELATAQDNCHSLSQRITQLESERNADQQQLLKLETSQIEATSRCERAEGQLELLQNQLDQERLQQETLKSRTLPEQACQPASPYETEQGGESSESALTGGVHHRRVWWAMVLAGIPLLGVASAAAFWIEPEKVPLVPGFVTPLTDETSSSLPFHSASLEDQKTDLTIAKEVISVQPYGKWGPPLLMEDKSVTRSASKETFEVPVKDLQANLLVLGFDLGHKGADGLIGPRTRTALDEFKLLYFPVAGIDGTPDSSHLAALVKYYADLAREDEKRFGVDSAILASIRIASLRTGVEFSYLMELAAAESSFDTSAKAFGSSASGLYQFTRETWLNVFKKHGGNYGLEEYASQVEFYVDKKGWKRPMVRDEDLKKHVLDLRHNPRISSIMAAESVKNNMKKLLSKFDREPGRTELYLTHFLGVDAAISFLHVLDKTPDRIAGDAFPVAAKNNRNVFHSRRNKPSTVTEVYELFSRKFNTERYRDGGRI